MLSLLWKLVLFYEAIDWNFTVEHVRHNHANSYSKANRRYLVSFTGLKYA